MQSIVVIEGFIRSAKSECTDRILIPLRLVLQLSKRDRSRLVLSSPGRVDLVRRIFSMSAVDRMGYRAIANALNDG